MHADRFKTSRTNAEQDKSCDVDREKKWDGGRKTDTRALITERLRECEIQEDVREIVC